MISGPGIFPLAGAGRKVNVARRQLAIHPGIAEIGKIVHRIVEIKIVVELSIHKIFQVIDAGHGEAAFDYIRMFEQRICGVISAEGGAHGGYGDSGRLTIVPDEGNDFLAKVGIENSMHVAAMKRMRGLVVKAQTVDRIHAVELQFAAVDEIGERADHGLAFQFPFVAGAGGKADQRRAIMAVNDNAEIEAQAMRIPAMDFTFHQSGLVKKVGSESMPAASSLRNRATRKRVQSR